MRLFRAGLTQPLARNNMEQEILQTLQEIRVILYFLLIVVSVGMLVWIVNWISNIATNFQKAWENDFIDQADKFFESANFDKLIEHCQNKLNKYPNHSTAIYWLARAKFELGDSAESIVLFQRLLELEPSWRDSHIEPYLKKLSSA